MPVLSRFKHLISTSVHETYGFALPRLCARLHGANVRGFLTPSRCSTQRKPCQTEQNLMQTLPNRSLTVTKAAKPVGRRVFVSPKAVPAVAAATAPMATVSFPAEYGLVAGAVAVSWFV